jgi:hypothetical protein
MLRSVNRRDHHTGRGTSSQTKEEVMKSRRIAILAAGAVTLLAVAPATSLAATHSPAHQSAVTRSDRSPDVKGSIDRSRADNGRPDSSSSADYSNGAHDTSRG